jgi:hypothetical protein
MQSWLVAADEIGYEPCSVTHAVWAISDDIGMLNNTVLGDYQVDGATNFATFNVGGSATTSVSFVVVGVS